MIIVIVGALVLLKYIYDIDIIGFLTQGKFKVFLDQFYSLGAKGWEKYNSVITGLWNHIVNFAKNIFSK